MPSVVALIPARSGSERVRDKNIRPLAGHPLLAYAIAAARQAGIFERIGWATTPERTFQGVVQPFPSAQMLWTNEGGWEA